MKKLFFSILMCIMALTVQAQRIAVLEFEVAKGIPVTDVDGISRMFMTYFQPAGYTLVDRNQVNKIISEQGFQRSSLTQEQMVRLGELLNVSKVVVGTVSMLGGKYQVDVSVDDVELGDYIATEGATFVGDYRTHVRELATKLAAKIAIKPAGTVNAQPTVAKKRSIVEVLYGYLKIFPNELGTFDSEPTSVISQINKQAQHGYNNWRIPTNEELSLMKANNYLGSGEYMTRESRRGKVLLVTDGDDYETVQAEARKVEEARIKAEQERRAEEARIKAEQERRAEEARIKAEEARIKAEQLRALGFVDLGLPSGTLWKDHNEPAGLVVPYGEVLAAFGTKLPTKEQFEELINTCRRTWDGNACKFTGPNGNSIVLPADGYFNSKGVLYNGEDFGGCYWSSTPNGLDKVWGLSFCSSRGDFALASWFPSDAFFSIRLVYNP